MEQKQEIIVNCNNVDIRLDTFLTKELPDFSRTYIKKLIDEGNILINGNVCKVSYKIKVNDVIIINIPEVQNTIIEPQNISLDILYQDEDIVVINKPRGMVVHPAVGNYTNTLVNGLLYNISNLSQINGVVRPGIVHRIDKDTSGVLVVAKNDNAHKKLSEQLKEHSMSRKYIAVVNGMIKKEELIINAPIGRSKVDRKKMALTVDGKNAVTHVKVIQKNEKYSFIEVTLETGRTHQIRVHLSAIGHSLVGDLVYSNKKNNFSIKGQALHAMTLGFIHPTTQEYMEFSAKIPDDFCKVIEDAGFNKSKINNKKV